MIAPLDLHLRHGGGPSHISRRLRAQIPSFNLTMCGCRKSSSGGS